MFKQAVILAGGKGTRLLPLTSTIPKPMVEVAGHPFLYWQLTYLKDQGVRNVLLLVSHLSDVVRDYFAKHPVAGLNLDYSVEKTPMGTGGAVYEALGQLEEKFWLLNGDSFLFIELSDMAKYAAKHSWDTCMATTNCKLIGVPGNLQVEKDNVISYKKDATAENGYPFVDAGVYLMSRSVVENGPRGNFDLGQYWPTLIAHGKLGSFEVFDRYFDIGTPERLKTFERHIGDYF